ncbi:cbb3-type cytochrome c oxidase subunit I [Magnetospira sp. QH-2]|uniref:cbb3-type cytochrome c oxidase subunit I n=1 Tax=Magnetospira sp. (strain QH-2) TaxID=1288970 RepID=UPI0003E811AC|nr:cbb3-type cytochrome c oxidase subunit I [Magnetospira sp. QH-2]CCQ74688.1 putative cytochrome c oxidase, subunit I [Magnetospira sp. QH-2]
MTAGRETRSWALIAVATLGLAGLLALLLVLSRVPYADQVLPWDLETFFYRALITHVVFSTVAWFLSLLALLSAEQIPDSSGSLPRRAGPALAVVGSLLLLAPALLDLGEASINDYVPLVDHPLFLAGLGLFVAGVAVPVIRLFLQPRILRRPQGTGLAALGLIFLLALVTTAIVFVRLHRGMDEAMGQALYRDRLFWGGGHLLQVVNTGLLLLAWDRLCQGTTGQPPLGPLSFKSVFLVLLAVSLAGPIYALVFDPLGLAYKEAFTNLLWTGLVLPPSVVLIGLLVRLKQSAAWQGAPEGPGLALSLVLFAVGGLLGYALGVADTRTPAHYHAVIGAVNLAFMVWFLVGLPPLLNRPAPRRKSVRAMGWLYGIGQLVHALGLFAAGSTGVPRKTAGMEQGLDTIAKKVSMGVAGVGGLLAVIGGILFIWLAAKMLLKRDPSP